MRATCALLLLAAACARPTLPPPAETARPEPVPAATTATHTAQTDMELDSIRVCVYKDGRLQEVPVAFDGTTGDTLVGGVRFSQAYPTTAPPYGAAAGWYVRNEPLTVNIGRHMRLPKYGLPRFLDVREVEKVGEREGVPIFAEAGQGTRPDVLYVLVRPGCEFQPYQAEYNVGAVRG